MNALSRWGPLLAWGGLLSFLAARPPDALPDTDWWLSRFDKVVHAAFYAPLGLLLHRAVRWRRPLASAAAGAGIGLLWGLLDEWIQSGVPGRSPEALDVLADVLGAAAGGLAGRALWRGYN